MAISLTEARDNLRKEGITLKEWAAINGFPLHAVRAVVYGRNIGNYGQSHKIAVALGVKDGPR